MIKEIPTMEDSSTSLYDKPYSIRHCLITQLSGSVLSNFIQNIPLFQNSKLLQTFLKSAILRGPSPQYRTLLLISRLYNLYGYFNV